MNKYILLTQNAEGKTQATFNNDDALQLPDNPKNDVTIKVLYSSINYKDALAVTGKGKIVRDFPFVPGIDLCGEVVESTNDDYTTGDKVLATGWGIGEKHWGGYSTLAKVSSKHLTRLPSNLTPSVAMSLGTAGFTSMLCVNALLNHGINKDAGPVLVSGASGGVGSIALKILADQGYQVTAVTSEKGKELVASLGASDFIMREEMSEECRPLENQKWAAAVDTVGDKVLARILAEMNYGGAVAACGLAGGFALKTTVMPFILRGVALLGIDSVYFPAAKRASIWEELAKAIDENTLKQITTEISLQQVPEYCDKLLKGEISGRVLVNLQN